MLRRFVDMAGLVQQHLPNHQSISLQNVSLLRSEVSLIGHRRPACGPTKARRSGSLVCQAASSGISATPPVPEGDVDIPLLTGLANTIEWLADYPEFYQKRFKKFGGLFRTNLLFNPMVVVTDENEVRRLLQAEHKLVESAWPQSMRNLLGPNAILTAPAKAHKKQRQILSQAFTEAAMRLYLPTVLDVCRYTLEQWSATEDLVLFYSAARAFAFDVAATVLTGTRFDGNTLVRMREDFDVYADGLFTIPLEIPGTPYAKAVKARKNIVAEIERLVLDAKASNEAQAAGRKNALRLLLDAVDENGEKLTLEQLKDQILTQLFAGHETTGATLSRVLPEIQKQPHILAKMRQEQAELIQQHGDDITYEVLDQMPYTDAVLKEVMRLHGIVDGVWRQALEDLEVQGRRVPKGWTVQLMVKRAGLDMPEFAADSERFRPERWLEESGAPVKKEPKGFMPFGEGPRKCLGMLLAKMEMRALLAVLAREYTVELEDPDEAWIQGFKPVNKLPGRVYKYQA